jgi:hypothetical protein
MDWRVNGTMQYAFSLPTKADKVPTGAEWIHEISTTVIEC